MTNRTQLRGIVVAANSLAEAQDLYAAVATGQNVKALHDENDTFVVLSSANSDINMLNPLTGADDLVEGDGLVEQMEFLSSDSGELVNTHYTVCLAGCNAHIIADDATMLKHCPACASAITDLDAETIAAHAAQEGGEDGECENCVTRESAIASGATLEEAVANYRNMLRGETEPTMVQSADALVAVAGAANYDAYTGDASTVVEHESPEMLQAIASSADEVEAHHFICASSDCATPHVISSDEMPVFCPACASGLLEPDVEEATASDDEDEDEDEDEDLDDEGLDEDEDEDYDDEDEDDDEDDEGLDDEDEGDEEDDELTLSLSSNRDRSPKRVRMKSEASSADAADSEVGDVEHVQASYMSIASAAAPEKFAVAYAGNILGDNVWYATIDRIPVAMALASKTQHKEIFDSEVFGRAVIAQASEHGIPVALTTMGFEEIKPEIEIGDHVSHEIRSQVAEQVQEVRAAAQQDKAELNERFGAAIAIAASGITRGFFKGKSNPIAQSLIQSLSACGIDNAAALVNQAFAAHSDSYHKALIAQASTIMGYDLDVQNQLATAVEASNIATASADQPIGRPVVMDTRQQEAVASADTQQNDFTQRLSMAMNGLGAVRR